MTKATANQAFLKGMKYLFFYSLTILSALLVLSAGLTGKEIFLKNFLLGYSIIVLTALVFSFFIVWSSLKKAIADGELDDKDIFKKDGKLSINFLRKID